MKKLYLRIRRSEYLLMIIGTAIMAVSANIFFSPAGMVPGGFTGLAMLIERLTASMPHGGIPLWLGNPVDAAALQGPVQFIRGEADGEAVYGHRVSLR